MIPRVRDKKKMQIQYKKVAASCFLQFATTFIMRYNSEKTQKKAVDLEKE